jgi:hypothetical protein
VCQRRLFEARQRVALENFVSRLQQVLSVSSVRAGPDFRKNFQKFLVSSEAKRVNI